ncbi:MAG: thermonuclease family protein [Thiogranum sp.]|nr:thermonuclease family protein [Thiogranum sp.]
MGAFFVLACFSQQSALAADCAPPDTPAAVTVSYVYDGDTLMLADQRKIRLIGVNTPEAARPGSPAEPLSLEARNRVRQILLGSGNQAHMLPGEEQTDHYARNLAHLWTPDGQNLTALLLREGLGWALAIPPNIRLLDCYLEAERDARAASRGVWNRPAFAATDSARLSLRSTGFQRVRGRVIRVNRGGGATWINLEGRFAIRIPDKHRHWFSPSPDQTWVGRNLEVRGWVKQIKGELRVSVQHPAAITLQPLQ